MKYIILSSADMKIKVSSVLGIYAILYCCSIHMSMTFMPWELYLIAVDIMSAMETSGAAPPTHIFHLGYFKWVSLLQLSALGNPGLNLSNFFELVIQVNHH